MRLIGPGRRAGPLHHRAHRAAVVGAVQQKGLQQCGITGNEARPQPGHVAALGQAREGHQIPEVVAAEFAGRLQRAQGWFLVKVNLRVTLVAGNDEAVAVAELKKLLPVRQGHHCTGRVAGRADINQLRARPGGFVHRRPVGRKLPCRQALHKGGLRAGQDRCAFVDLVHRVRTHHRRTGPRGVDDGLRKRKERLARACHRQHLRGRIQRHAVTPLQPAADGVAKTRFAQGGRVGRQAREGFDERFFDQCRGGMSGLADAQADRRQVGSRHDVCGQLAPAFKRVGTQARQQRVHAQDYPGGAPFRRGGMIGV